MAAPFSVRTAWIAKQWVQDPFLHPSFSPLFFLLSKKIILKKPHENIRQNREYREGNKHKERRKRKKKQENKRKQQRANYKEEN